MSILVDSRTFSKLAKLKIEAFDTRSRVAPALGEFEAMFNPETYSLAYTNKFKENKVEGNKGKELKFSLTETSKFSLKLILDGTGVTSTDIEDFTTLTGEERASKVYQAVEKFLKLTLAKGDRKEPSYLRLKWGKLILDCRLANVTVKYTLFDREGNPQRAELNTKFMEDKVVKVDPAAGTGAAGDTNLPPKEGETLPKWLARTRDSINDLIGVAERNGLDSIRGGLLAGRLLNA